MQWTLPVLLDLGSHSEFVETIFIESRENRIVRGNKNHLKRS